MLPPRVRSVVLLALCAAATGPGGVRLGAQEGAPPTRQQPDQAPQQPEPVRRDTARAVFADPATIPIPSDGGDREVRRLTLEDALRYGRVHNLSLLAESLTPEQLGEDVRIRDAFFEPELFGSASYTDSQSPPRNAFQPAIQRKTLSGDIGLRQRLSTGALYELTFTPLRVRQTSSLAGAFPEEQYSAEFAARITQPLLRGGWGASNLADLRVAEASLTSGQSRFERTVQDTLIQIVQAYWELVFAREDYRVTVQALDLAREQLRITNERIRVRELAERDRVFDEADVARRQEALIRAENAILQREDELRNLMLDDSDGRLWMLNLQPTSPIEGEFAAPELDWREASRGALRLRPDLVALRADVRQAEIAYERAAQDVLPQLDLVGSYTSDGVRENFDDAFGDAAGIEFPDWSVALQFSVPIGNTAARAARERAALGLEQARRRLYAAELDVTREVRTALRDLTTAAQAIAASRESVRLAETQLDTERERLRVGRGTIFEVQQRNQELLDARQQLLRNQIDFRVNESRLRYVQGILQAPDA
ncbi:MAG: TolC family protein [Planctomycetes bacterium]|nr:TolC family protein [Planctomycetota bacterium]